MAIFETHLKLSGDRSPFAVLRNKMADAILTSAREAMDALAESVRGIYRDIGDWLEAMLNTEVTQAELEVIELLQKFHTKAQGRYCDIREALSAIAEKYEPDQKLK